MSILLIIDWCGENENEFWEVYGESKQTIGGFDGQYINSTDCSDEMENWWESLWRDGERLPMCDDFKPVDRSEPCGPFEKIVVCGMLP